MEFLRTETTPLVKALQWFTFGHCEVTPDEFNLVSEEFKNNIKLINKALGGKNHFVGQSLTIVDIYFCLTQVEMQ